MIPATPPTIIFIVVISLAVMALMYVGALTFCVVCNISAQPEIVQSFQAAGIFVLGHLSGMLSSTKIAPQPPADSTSKSVTETTTKSETTSEPEKKDS